MSYQVKSATDQANYRKLAGKYYNAACGSNVRDYLAAHKYALYLEFHKNSNPVDIKKIESLYYICLSECPLYSHGLFDYGKFLFNKCSLYGRGLEFMSFGIVESVYKDSYKEQFKNYLMYCEINGIPIEKSPISSDF